MYTIKAITDTEFNNIRDFAKDNFGIALSNEKKTLVFSRLSNILTELGLDNFTDYFNYLKKDKTGNAVKIFIDKISTNHTYFMREKEHFDFLTKEVFEYIKKKYDREKDLRLWCSACSSGEEPYTLEMLALEHFENGWNTDILASDISTAILNKAYKGVYSNESVEQLPQNWIKKYFDIYDEKSKIIKSQVKQKLLFRKINLMDKNFNFKKKLQIIFCRNVMIYFDNKEKEELVKKFYDITDEGGFLFIGHSESLSNFDTKYKYVMPAVYRK